MMSNYYKNYLLVVFRQKILLIFDVGINEKMLYLR